MSNVPKDVSRETEELFDEIQLDMDDMVIRFEDQKNMKDILNRTWNKHERDDKTIKELNTQVRQQNAQLEAQKKLFKKQLSELEDRNTGLSSAIDTRSTKTAAHH